jgi:hypothetical protein
MISEAIEFFTLHLKNKDSDLSIRHFLCTGVRKDNRGTYRRREEPGQSQRKSAAADERGT